MKREPVLTISSITSLIAAVLTLLVVFGVKLNGEQQSAILGVAAIAAPLVVALVSRPRVTPVAPVNRGELGLSEAGLALGLAVAALVIVLFFVLR